MAMTKNIQIVVITLLLLLFGIKHQFLFVFSFVWESAIFLFEAALLRPLIAKLIAPCSRQKAEKELQHRTMEQFAQENELLDFLLDFSRQLV